jgi:hypothetical protein
MNPDFSPGFCLTKIIITFLSTDSPDSQIMIFRIFIGFHRRFVFNCQILTHLFPLRKIFFWNRFKKLHERTEYHFFCYKKVAFLFFILISNLILLIVILNPFFSTIIFAINDRLHVRWVKRFWLLLGYYYVESGVSR